MKRTTMTLAVTGLLLIAGAAGAQVNLVPNLPTGWAWPLVPRPAGDATSTSVPLPASLTGDAALTWLNSAWFNAGSAASGSFHNNTILDGQRLIVDRTCASLAGGTGAMGINGGPFTMPGGRHTLELRVDSGGVVTETSEADNNIAHQWVWTPAVVAAGVRVTRTAPPDPTGGWSSIPAGQDKYNNCDGVRLTTGTGWDALFAWSPDAAVDNQLLIYEPSSGATSGFASWLGASARAGRGVEAVIANGHNVGARNYDVGVERVAGSGSYYAEHVTGQALSWGDSITVTFGQDEMLKLFDVTVPAAGEISVWLRTTTTDPSVALLWADRSANVIGLSALTIGAATDAQGNARLDAVATAAGSHAVVVFRDPDWGTGPRSFGIKVATAKPDLVPFAPADWHSPLVPHETMVNSGEPVALPDTLPVTASGPLLYWSLRNVGGATCPAASDVGLSIDGTDRGPQGAYPLTPGEVESYYPIFYEGRVLSGRHTLAMEANHDVAYPEASRANNAYGEQYCWGPSSVASTTFPEQPMYPPAPTGGWDRIGDGSGEVLWYNSAAQRLPTAAPTAWWQGFAVLPDWELDFDFDLRLHEALSGSKSGLGEYLCRSWFGQHDTDYVLANLNLTPRRPFDVGIIDMGEVLVGTGSFTAQYVESRTLGTAGTLTLAPYLSDRGDDLLQLYEWYFAAGYWMIHLTNLAPYDRYAMALHQAEEVYTSRPLDAEISPEPGDDVWLHVNVQKAGWCCLAVFRPDRSAPNSPEYQINMYPGVSAAPEPPAVPAATRLTGAAPNPFNPRVRIAFDLAAPGRVRLAIFDLHGALVHVLADADLAAGRQEVTWDGRDGVGRAMPSGTYFARFTADGVDQTRKLMLLR